MVTKKLRKNLNTWGFRTITLKLYFWFKWNLGIFLNIKWVGTLLIFRKIRQRSRSQWPNNFEIFFRKWGFRAITPKVYIWFSWSFGILWPLNLEICLKSSWMTLSAQLLWNYWSEFEETLYVARTSYVVVYITREFWFPNFCWSYGCLNLEICPKSSWITLSVHLLWNYWSDH